MPEEEKKDLSEQIAIIGMAGEFPKSPTLKEFWGNLAAGNELISFFSQSDLIGEDLDENIIKHPEYVSAKGYLENSTDFDAGLFEFSRRESELIDPQQRRLLTWSWAALENSGYDPTRFKGLIGVFASASLSSYFYFNLFPRLQSSSIHSSDEMLAVMGNEKDFLATRISYKLNLTGPSKTIQTACSSSLVAVHDACQSLLSYESDIALAGGVSITFPRKKGYYYVQDGINSKDGHCRPFDRSSSGTLSGNGGGVVVLKRLDEAVRDCDTIHAVIRGSAINNDGANKVGFTAPSLEGQARAIATAHLAAEVSPESITYIEAHGTGTQLGDPIEIAALTQAFKLKTKRKHFCSIGSAKANIGHLDAAAGIAGLIKTVLSIKNQTIPKLVHFAEPNPKILSDNSPFCFPLESKPWENKDYPLRAGVSSFGIGGTNAHLIVEAPPNSNLSEPSDKEWQLLIFSAKTLEKLKELIRIYSHYFSNCLYNFEDIAFTLQLGRRALEHRVFFCCRNLIEAQNLLQSYLTNEQIRPLRGSPKELMQIGEKWTNNEFIDWESMYQGTRRQRVPLPHYPFEKKSFFLSSFAENIENKRIIQKDSKDSEVKNLSLDQRLREIWCRLLKLENVDPSQNFFSLGGDSLLALELADELRKIFFIKISLDELFEKPTLNGLNAIVYKKLIETSEKLSPEDAQKILSML